MGTDKIIPGNTDQNTVVTYTFTVPVIGQCFRINPITMAVTPAFRFELLGVFGASLFYGDTVLTPAISVLSAVEGLEVGTTAFKPYIVPLATGILVGLFLIQKRGTGFVGLLFVRFFRCRL